MNVFCVLIDCDEGGDQFVTRLDVRAASESEARSLAMEYCRSAAVPMRSIEEIEPEPGGEDCDGLPGVIRSYGRGYYDHDDEGSTL